MRFWSHLTADEQARIEDEIRFFLVERSWEGCGGLELTEEMQVIIAAQACRLLLGRPEDRFANVTAILVYPSGTFTEVLPSPIGGPPRVVQAGGVPVLGQAFDRGQIILSWQHSLEGAVDDADGQNVVLHEFAHALDMMNGPVDGMPRMSSRAEAVAWHDAMTAAYERCREGWQARSWDATRPPLRPYALTNPGEFFAVATEVFFERPDALAAWDEDLYRVLSRWYRQDPRSRERALFD